MPYSVISTTPKVLSILLKDVSGDDSSLQKIISIAQKEFPNIQFKHLILTCTDNSSVIYLQEKRS